MALVEQGETIVAPKGWWHYAVSLDTSVSTLVGRPIMLSLHCCVSSRLEVTIMRNFYSTSNQWDLILGCALS